MATIFKEWIFEHAQYKAVFDTLVEEIERVLEGSSPFTFPLLGDSRAGKTALLEDVVAHFAGHVSPSGHPRVVRIAMPSTASNGTLARRIITLILGDVPVKGSSHEIIERARLTMEAAGVLVLLVDETNHLVEKRATERAQTKENRHAPDWFKELGDLSGISVVVAGLSHVIRMYVDNDQLENRGLVGARIQPYAWSVPRDRVEFQSMMLAGISHLREHGWKIDVTEDRLTRLAYLGGAATSVRRETFSSASKKSGEKASAWTSICCLGRTKASIGWVLTVTRWNSRRSATCCSTEPIARRWRGPCAVAEARNHDAAPPLEGDQLDEAPNAASG